MDKAFTEVRDLWIRSSDDGAEEITLPMELLNKLLRDHIKLMGVRSAAFELVSHMDYAYDLTDD